MPHVLRTPARVLPRLRIFLCAAVLCVLAPAAARAQSHDHAGGGGAKSAAHHPTPRRDLPADYVVRADNVPERARDEYTMAARIPQVLDGLYCHCDCHERDGLRSLLDCFHGDMGTSCAICQGQVRRAFELHEQGRSLNDIRKILDAEFS
jgi:Protein of unknown function with PCYCGC motif